MKLIMALGKNRAKQRIVRKYGIKKLILRWILSMQADGQD